MTDEASITATAICDTLGRRAIAERLGVGITAVSNASVEGSFPPGWFAALDEMCEEQSLPCPRSLFRFRAIKPKCSKQSGAAI